MRHLRSVVMIGGLALAIAVGVLLIRPPPAGQPGPDGSPASCRTDGAESLPAGAAAGPLPAFTDAWSAVNLPSIAGATETLLHDVAVGGEGRAVAVGRIGGATWQGLIAASDDGLTWRSFAAGTFTDLTATAEGWLLAGSVSSTSGEPHPAVWHSTDGVSWDCMLLPTPATEPFGIAARAVTGATIAVIGQVHAGCPPGASCAASPMLWLPDADGGWWPSRGAADGTGGVPGGGGTYAVTESGHLVGIDADGVWASADGDAWELIVPGEAPGVAESLAVGPGGLIAVGATYEGGAVQAWIGLLEAP